MGMFDFISKPFKAITHSVSNAASWITHKVSKPLKKFGRDPFGTIAGGLSSVQSAITHKFVLPVFDTVAGGLTHMASTVVGASSKLLGTAFKDVAGALGLSPMLLIGGAVAVGAVVLIVVLKT